MRAEQRAGRGRKGVGAPVFDSRIEPKSAGNSILDWYPAPEAVRPENATLPTEERVTQFFEQFRNSIYRYLMVLVENRYDAEELTQDVFLQLYRCLHRGETIDNVRGWLFRVAHNYAINQKCRSKRLVALELATWDDFSGRTQDPAPDPEESLLLREASKRIQVALQELTPTQRQCLVLRAEGFRYAEIAEILRITIANVAQSLRRGLTKLMRDTHE